ncbi:MAG: aspartate/glutamate racemase family protein [Treponema sp.]|nr:aspartate/glutamate racemase family protein [Treponema sp.]
MSRRILVINPNSSVKMTEDIRNTAAALEDDRLVIETVKMDGSPEVLESFADYTAAGAEVVRYLREKQAAGFGFDGVLLACMGDPCLFGVKEVCRTPAAGIAEAGISAALLMGYKFSILASSAKAKPMMESMVMSYGLGSRMASVEAFNIPIVSFMENRELLREMVLKTSRMAVEKGAEVLILGCAGMTMLGGEVSASIGIPVIDPVKAGIVMLNALLDGGFTSSRGGLYK